MIQIAIMGLGTVGTGVAKVVAENARQIERKLKNFTGSSAFKGGVNHAVSK